MSKGWLEKLQVASSALHDGKNKSFKPCDATLGIGGQDNISTEVVLHEKNTNKRWLWRDPKALALVERVKHANASLWEQLRLRLGVLLLLASYQWYLRFDAVEVKGTLRRWKTT